jgi:hypothetical protein
MLVADRREKGLTNLFDGPLDLPLSPSLLVKGIEPRILSLVLLFVILFATQDAHADGTAF